MTQFADQPAFVNMGQTITYRRLKEQSRALPPICRTSSKLGKATGWR